MVLKERKLVEYFINKLTNLGWQYKKQSELNRTDLEESLLIENLRNAIKKINKGISERDIDFVLNELKSKSCTPEGILDILNYLKFGISKKLEEQKYTKQIMLIDYENLENNEFIISDEVTFRHGLYEARMDLVFYINGIPIIVAEFKNPTLAYTSWEDAYRDIKNYEKRLPNLFKYVQIGIAVEKNVRYFPIVPWLDSVNVHRWLSEELKDTADEIEHILDMLKPERVVDIIKNFLFIKEERGRFNKIVTRYVQYYSANKIYERVVKYVRNESNKKNGLIWHWQGSGKTLTMLFAANKLYFDKNLSNPTIFFIVDRIELQEQIFEELSAFKISPLEKIESKENLKNVILYDNGKGKRGFFVVLIHKFNLTNKDLEKILEELKEISKNQETIITRKNIIVFVDEAHRTQYGILANFMRQILKNAAFIGFTGTPIYEKDRNTFELFAYPEEGELYLDKYFIGDSIRDGFTVKFAYVLASEDLRLNKEDLDLFLSLEEDELNIEKLKKEELSKFKLIFENEKRIKTISKYIVDHFLKNVDNKFKAFVVAASRKACVLYKKYIDEFLKERLGDKYSENFSEIVMSYSSKEDDPIISEYLEKLIKKYKTADIDEINKIIVSNFKDPNKLPKILIVTDMLLTGFDAPILQTMYLDKPLKRHKLLQTVARVNRPFPARGKEYGLIIDFVGVFGELKRTIGAYEGLDAEKYIIPYFKNCYKVREDLEYYIKEIKEIIGNFNIDDTSYENLCGVVNKIIRENKDKRFLELYRIIRRIFSFMGSCREFIESDSRIENYKFFKFLTAVYELYKRTLLSYKNEEEDFFLKEEYIREILEEIKKTIEIKEISFLDEVVLDENFIKNLDEKYKSLDSKIINRITLIVNVIRKKPELKIYTSIREKIEKILEEYKQQKEETIKLLEKLDSIYKEFEEIEKKRKEENISEYELEILILLESYFKNREIIKKYIKKLFEEIKKYENYVNIEYDKAIKNKIRRIIREKILIDGIEREIGFYLDFSEREELSNKIYETIEKYLYEKNRL